PIKWKVASIQPSELFAVEGAIEGVVEPGDVQMLQIQAIALADRLVAGQGIAGSIRIETDDTHAPAFELPLHFVPEGASLEFNPVLDFGVRPLASPPATSTISLHNTGTRSTFIPLVDVSDEAFSLVNPQAL